MTVPWSAIDPTDPSLRATYPWLKPVIVTVGAGQALYLPGQFWHAVGQVAPEEDPEFVRKDGEISGTLAVNYWFDTEFGARYEGVRMVENLGRLVREAALS